MRKKKNLFNFHDPGGAIIAIVIFGCLLPVSFAQQNEPNPSEDALFDSKASNTGDNVAPIEKSFDPVFHRQSDKGLVISTEEDVDETQTGEVFVEIKSAKENDETSNIHKDAFEMDPIFNEIIEPSLRINNAGKGNATSTYLKSKQPYLYNAFDGVEDWERDKRGALHLYGIIKCATGCNPLGFKGYGCFCGFMGAGNPVDGIDTCCKMHDWCYSTSSCHGLEWDLPYFVPFKWKCNGGAPYCIPGKTKRTGRDSCSHQLCECDREFAMCLHNFCEQPKGTCPLTKVACLDKKARFFQNLLMGFTSGHGMHHPHQSGAVHFPRKPSRPHHQHHTSNTPRKNLNPFKKFLLG